MKGIFYSTITVIFIVPVIFFAFVYLDAARTASEGTVTKVIGDKIASFSRSIESDLPRAMDIVAKRSIKANIDYIEKNGMPLDSAEGRISESMVNGTVFGATGSNNFTITSWAAQLNAKGSDYGFTVNVTVLDINITPLDSYHIAIGTIISVNVTEPASGTILYRVYGTNIPVSIEGQIDPLYMLNTNGLLKRTIQAPNITVYGTSNLDTAVAQAYYMQSDQGPSFLDRLEGRLDISSAYSNAANIIGLESFVYVPELQANGLTVKPEQNSVDYLYFSSSNQPGQQVSGSAYNWLRLNSVQAATYGVTLV